MDKLEPAICAHEWALCQLTLCFEFKSTSESKGKKLKVVGANLTLRGGSKVKCKPIQLFGIHDLLEVVFKSQTSKTNNKGDTGY